jgi:hypothetical protein
MQFTKLPFTNKYEGKTVERNGSRHYVIRPDGHSKDHKPDIAYPSITTVLSATDDPTWLIKWRERVGDAKADEISLNAITKGTGLHSLCENYIVGEEINPVKDIPGGSKTMFNNVRSALDQHLTGYWASEVALYSDKFRLAGRTDLIGRWDHIPSVIDFKSNHKPDHKKEEHIGDYKIQVCAYKMMWDEMYPEYPKLEKGVLLIASMFHRQIIEFDAMEGYRGLIERRKKYFEMFEQPKEKIVWF